MPKGPSPRRFAQAIFQIASERNQLDKWAQDLRLMEEYLGEKEFVTFLESTRIPSADKTRVINEVLSNADPLARNLLSLLATRKATRLLPNIAGEYRRLLDAHRGIVRGEVVTAVDTTPDMNRNITGSLKALIGKEVIVANRVDGKIVGGFVAKVGDQLIDGSTKTRLEELRRSLSGASA